VIDFNEQEILVLAGKYLKVEKETTPEVRLAALKTAAATLESAIVAKSLTATVVKLLTN